MFSKIDLLKNHYNYKGQKLLDELNPQSCVDEIIKNIEQIMFDEPNKYLVLNAAKDLLTKKLDATNTPKNSLSEIRKISQQLKILSALRYTIEEIKNNSDMEDLSQRISNT